MGIAQIPLGTIETNRAIQACPSSTYASFTQETCYSTCSQCGDGILCDDSLKQCITCEAGKFYENNTKTCLTTCPANSWGDKIPHQVCVAVCSSGKFSENNTQLCQTTCSTGFGYPVSRICVATCPSDWWGNEFPDGKRCVSTCPSGKFGENSSALCLPNCLTGFRENSTSVCQKICTTGYADPYSKLCVAACPGDSYADEIHEPMSSSLISDLASSTFTDSDIVGWSFTNIYNGPSGISTCGSATLLGGFNKYAAYSILEKTYSLPPHDWILLQIDIYELDTLAEGEGVTISVDGQIIDTIARHASPASNLCGGSANDYGLFLYVKALSHTSSTFTLKLSNNLKKLPDSESYGFRNIQITTYLNQKSSKFCSRSCTTRKYDTVNRKCLFPKTCREVLIRNKAAPDGPYLIEPRTGKVMQVYCKQGITLFQKRVDGSTNFFLPWEKYRNGFGNPEQNFWLGLENLYSFLNQQSYDVLSYDLQISASFQGQSYSGLYHGFRIGNEGTKYTINWDSRDASSTLQDCLNEHQGSKFCTYDSDNDLHPGNNLALLYQSGWWYFMGFYSNFNGKFGSTDYGKGIDCYQLTTHTNSLSAVDMGIVTEVYGQILSGSTRSDCAASTFASMTQDACFSTCGDCGVGVVCDSSLRQCFQCEDNKYYENSTKLCVSRCPDNSWGDTTPLRICVATCSYGKYMQNSTMECVSYQNCREIYIRNRASPDGVYFISPAPGIIIQVFCDMNAQGATFFQRRNDNTDFNQN